MKRFFVATLVVAACTTFFFSCTKSNADRNPVFSALVNNGGWDPTRVNADTTGNTFEVVAIKENSNDATLNQYISLKIPGFGHTTGMFTVDDSLVQAFYSSDAATPHYGTSGQINIKSFTATSVTGTFNFSCADGTQVTVGEFNVPLQ